MRAGYKKTVLGEIPESWEIVRFGELISNHCYGPRFSSKDYSITGNVKTIRGTDINQTGDILYEQVPTAQLPKELVENHKLKDGDLVMITTADCGLTGVYFNTGFPFIASAYAVRISLNAKGYPSFFKYIFQTRLAKNQIEKYIRKGTVANLPGSDILKFTFAKPPVEEQKKIAEILSTVDDKIALIDQQLSETAALKKGLMQRLLSKGIGHTKFKDSALGEIPESWEVVEMKDIYPKIVVGFVGSVSNSYCNKDEGVLFIRTLNVRDGRFSLNGVQYVNTSFHNKNLKSQIVNEDILIARVGANMGMICKVNGLNEPANSANIIIIKNEKGINSDFYKFFLCSSKGQKQIHSQGSGGAQEVFNTKLAKKLKVVVPSQIEQEKIARILNSIDEKLKVLSEKKTNYQKLKKGLMQQLLTGKIRVNGLIDKKVKA